VSSGLSTLPATQFFSVAGMVLWIQNQPTRHSGRSWFRTCTYGLPRREPHQPQDAGQTVWDLGCGAGLDSILAARRVGPTKIVIGIDLTEDMLVGN